MSAFRLILKEIGHRILNFLLALLAIGAAIALFVAILTMGKASEREAVRLMRDMGFNLRILPKDTEMEDFWATDFAEHDMPEAYVHRLASEQALSVNHLVATLQKKVISTSTVLRSRDYSPTVSPIWESLAPIRISVCSQI